MIKTFYSCSKYKRTSEIKNPTFPISSSYYLRQIIIFKYNISIYLILANTHVMNRLCEYDLIDLQNAHDGDHGFVLVYQDYLTKFTQLRPLKSKSPIELGTTLMDIFCIF